MSNWLGCRTACYQVVNYPVEFIVVCELQYSTELEVLPTVLCEPKLIMEFLNGFYAFGYVCTTEIKLLN